VSQYIYFVLYMRRRSEVCELCPASNRKSVGPPLDRNHSPTCINISLIPVSINRHVKKSRNRNVRVVTSSLLY
jgi:hypothetical protein